MYIDQSILSKGCNAVIFDEFLDYGEATIDDLFRMLYVCVGILLRSTSQFSFKQH